MVLTNRLEFRGRIGSTLTDLVYINRSSGNAVNVNGNIIVTGTVDGRDLSNDGSKLDGISAGADVTPSWVPSTNPNYLTASSTDLDSRYYTETETNQFLALKAPLASPAFTGTPTAPTPSLSDNNTNIATTEYVKGQNYLTAVSTDLDSRYYTETEVDQFLNLKLNKSGGTMTGSIDMGTNDITNAGEIEANEFIGNLRGAVSFTAKAGEALTKGDVVYISGISGNQTVVAKADADNTSKMPAFGVASETVSINANVTIINFGRVSNLDTSGFSEGDELFVSNTAGVLSSTAPSGESSALQKMAKVTRSHASSGSITVMGAGRTNAVPNLNEGRLFVGNSSNQAVADGTVHVDIANSRVGIGTTSPTEKLEVAPDSDVSAIIGRAHIGKAAPNDFATFSHVDHASSTNYALNQNQHGSTKLNYANGRDLSFRRSNVEIGGFNASADFFVDTDTLYVDSSTDRVGIGTTTPSTILHIESATPTVTVKSTGTASSKIDLAGTYTTWSLENQHVNGATNDMFRIYNSQLGSNALTIHRLNNNVGIGETNPAQKLVVSGSTSISSNLYIGSLSSTGTRIQADSGQIRGYYTTSTDARFHLGRDAFASGSAGLAMGGSGGYSAIGCATNGNDLLFSTNMSAAGQGASAERMRIDSSGNVGIGTTSPSKKLHVEGITYSTLGFKVANGNSIGALGYNSALRFNNGNILVNNSSAAEFARFDATNSRVGIGTTSPSKHTHLM